MKTALLYFGCPNVFFSHLDKPLIFNLLDSMKIDYDVFIDTTIYNFYKLDNNKYKIGEKLYDQEIIKIEKWGILKTYYITKISKELLETNYYDVFGKRLKSINISEKLPEHRAIISMFDSITNVIDICQMYSKYDNYIISRQDLYLDKKNEKDILRLCTQFKKLIDVPDENKFIGLQLSGYFFEPRIFLSKNRGVQKLKEVSTIYDSERNKLIVNPIQPKNEKFKVPFGQICKTLKISYFENNFEILRS